MGRTLDLLIVDDEQSQVALVRTLLMELGFTHRCYHCLSGDAALNFLNSEPPYTSAPRPHLILMDVNMPGMNGCEVLRRIKSDPKFRTIPVIMLSTSRAMRDVESCYGAHANAYVKKPTDVEGTMTFLRNLNNFWTECEIVGR